GTDYARPQILPDGLHPNADETLPFRANVNGAGRQLKLCGRIITLIYGNQWHSAVGRNSRLVRSITWMHGIDVIQNTLFPFTRGDARDIAVAPSDERHNQE